MTRRAREGEACEGALPRRAPQMSHTPLRTLPALRHAGQSATSTAARRRPRAAVLWSIVTSCDDSQGLLERETDPRGLSSGGAPLVPSVGRCEPPLIPQDRGEIYCNRRTAKQRITM